MEKNLVKRVRTAESTISMVLGIVVVVVVGYLLFRYFKSSPLISSNPTSEGQTSDSNKSGQEENPQNENLPAKYTVQKGDSLWKISMKFYGSGYNWVDISKENKIRNSEILFVGKELTIPDVPVKNPVISNTQVSPQAATENKTGNSISGDTYTVQKGDSLWSISVRAYSDGFKWPEIAKANKLAHPNTIHPGNTLTIPR